MSKSIDERLSEFRKSMRKQQIQSMKQTQRKILTKNLNARDLSNIFSISDSPLSKKPYLTILQNCLDILLNPFSLSNSNKSYQSPQPEFTIETHINFWRQFIYDVQDHIKETAPLLIQFALKIRQKYQFSIVQQSQQFTIEFMNILYELSPYLSRMEKDKMLQWVGSVAALPVILEYVNCTEFISYKEYPNVYEILKKGLRHKNLFYATLAVKTLQKILKYAQHCSTYEIYEHEIQIPIQLMNFIKKHCYDFQTTDFWLTLFYIFNTFEEAVIYYSSMGIIDVCGRMISSNIASNIFGGLQILRLFSEVRNSKIVDQLIVNQQLQCSKMWLAVSLQKGIHRHPNVQIRRSFLSIIKNIIVGSNEHQVQALCGGFSNKDRNVFDCFDEVLRNDHAEDVRLCALKCISRLLFSGQQQKSLYQNLVLMTLENRQMLPCIDELSNHPWETIREYSRDIMARICQIRNASQMQCL